MKISTRRFVWCILLILPGSLLMLLAGLQSERPEFSGAEEARRSFAGLLKIPLKPPAVTVESGGVERGEEVLLEDVSWNSLDGEEPFAYVVRPRRDRGRLPAVICLHGSSGSRESMTTENFGRGEWTRYGDSKPHQRLLGWARQLARQGYLTLALTQRGLDRRTPDTNARSKEHLLYGNNLMGRLIFENRQAITYLMSRPDVDPERIGITGMSFGGITSFYTWLVDDRLTAAASICGGVGSLKEFLKTGSRGYHGVYWWVPGILAVGDHGHFAAALAPAPLMLWAPLDDIGMGASAVQEFVNLVEPAYRNHGKSENLRIHRPPGEHEFTLEAYQAMKDFFDHHLKPN